MINKGKDRKKGRNAQQQDQKNASSGKPSIYFPAMTYPDNFYRQNIRIYRIDYPIVTCPKAICIFSAMQFTTSGGMGIVR